MIHNNTAVASTNAASIITNKSVQPSTTAMIVVNVPTPEAKLTIDGNATVSTSQTRYFETPTLKPGKTYAYNLEATFVKDGVPMTVTKKVTFKAGDNVRCDLVGETAVAGR